MVIRSLPVDRFVFGRARRRAVAAANVTPKPPVAASSPAVLSSPVTMAPAPIKASVCLSIAVTLPRANTGAAADGDGGRNLVHFRHVVSRDTSVSPAWTSPPPGRRTQAWIVD